jgi:hypothetical protein
MLRTHSTLPLALQTPHFHLSRTVNNHITVTYNAQSFFLLPHPAWLLCCTESPHPLQNPMTAVVLRTAIKQMQSISKKNSYDVPSYQCCMLSILEDSQCLSGALPAVCGQTSFWDWSYCIRMRCINQLWPYCVSSRFENKRLVKRKVLAQSLQSQQSCT